MTRLLYLAVAGAVIATTAGPAAAQYTEQTRRQNQQYSETLRKGQVVERQERVVQTASVVRIEDQFPEQGADNPSGLLSNGDLNDEFHPGGEIMIRPGHPFTLGRDPNATQLDPQEAPPHYRRGPVLIRQ